MIETLFQNQIKNQEHLGSPLLNEREVFISPQKYTSISIQKYTILI